MQCWHVRCEAVWKGMNVLPLSLRGRCCWSSPWEPCSQFSLPDLPVWSLMEHFVTGMWGIKKTSKELTFKAFFFKHIWIHFFLCVWKRKCTQGECIITVIYSWYNHFKWKWCIQRKISLLATEPLLQSSLSLEGYEAIWHNEMDSSRCTLVPLSDSNDELPSFACYN